MSDVDSEKRREQAERMAARKRYNMKALGALVDSNRLTGVSRPDGDEHSGPHRRTAQEEPVDDTVSADEVEPDVSADVDARQDEVEPDVSSDVDGRPDDGEAAAAEAADVDELADAADAADAAELVDVADVEEVADEEDPVAAPDASTDLLEDVADDAPQEVAEAAPPENSASDLAELYESGTPPRVSPAPPTGEATIELRSRARPKVDRRAAPDLDEDDFFEDDGVDRSNLGGRVTRAGLAWRVDLAPASTRPDPRTSEQPLARQILDEEISEGGRLSNPRDVPGIVLNLAKDIPAAAAVSVVRIDEEIELVGNTIDPSVEPGMLASMFSGLFRSIQIAAGTLAEGPLGTVHDLVIEGEHMDLILRPLGVHYYLMVLEDRASEQANLSSTRMRMAALAPGLAAILAHGDGED